MPFLAGFKPTVPFFINGEQVRSAKTFPVISATTGKIVHYAQSAGIDEAMEAAAAAGHAFRTWKRASISMRRSILQRVAAIFQREIDEFVRLQRLETSADEAWSRSNANITVSYLEEIAAQVSGEAGTGSIPQNERPGTISFVFKEPVGPVLCIPPWNAALILATRGMATAIAAGYTVVLNASELSPATHAKIVEAFIEAGLPSGVLNSIQVRREDAVAVTEALIADTRIRKIAFIGSAAVGKIIAATAGTYLKPVLMELGGKCPAIVCDDADLDKAAMLCAKGATLHHGQICFSTERIIVHHAVASRFKELLLNAFRALSTEDSTAVTMGIAQHALDVLEDAKSRGIEFPFGVPQFNGLASLKASIVEEPKKDARIFDEETFGPSASLYIARNDEEAIVKANDSAFGLNATIHTNDMQRGLRMARELEYGQVHINSISAYVSPTGPPGGVKSSGWGRQNSKWGMEEFYQTKFISWHGDTA